MTQAERSRIHGENMLRWICSLALLLLVNSAVFAQAPLASKTEKNLKSLRFENVEIKSQTIGTLLSELSLTYNIPIGAEIAPSDNRLGNYELNLKRGTLSELLTQFVRQHDRYTWTIKDGVVNIAPAENSRDFLLRNLLETRIRDFSVPRNTGCSALADSLMATAELKKLLEESNTIYRGLDYSGFYIPQLGRKFSLAASERTLQATLNAIVSTSPTAKFWVLIRNEDGTISLGFSALQEDTPAGKRFSPSGTLP